MPFSRLSSARELTLLPFTRPIPVAILVVGVNQDIESEVSRPASLLRPPGARDD